ncbi:hypothetical protein BBJ28_00004815 [Nothophytophthora sp. Chile5]|nr:hypothetical protein BBJ28_00004815 [Nothophytophthora sp. Chile5]
MDISTLLSATSDSSLPSPVRRSSAPCFGPQKSGIKTRLLPPTAALCSLQGFGSGEEAIETTDDDEKRKPTEPHTSAVITDKSLVKKRSREVIKSEAPLKRQRSEAVKTPATSAGLIVVSRKPKPKRKRKSRLSATQIAARESVAAYNSKVFNLELDVFNLQQQVRFLEERRDLHVTRMLLARSVFQDSATSVAAVLFSAFLAGALGKPLKQYGYTFSRVHPRLKDQAGIPYCVHQWGRNCEQGFANGSYALLSTRTLSFVEHRDGDAPVYTEEDDKARRVCGIGGCVMEAVGEFRGRPKRATIGAMFPHLLSDLGLIALLTRQTVAFPTRLAIYFNAQGQIVKHVTYALMYAPLKAMVETVAPEISTPPVSLADMEKFDSSCCFCFNCCPEV